MEIVEFLAQNNHNYWPPLIEAFVSFPRVLKLISHIYSPEVP